MNIFEPVPLPNGRFAVLKLCDDASVEIIATTVYPSGLDARRETGPMRVAINELLSVDKLECASVAEAQAVADAWNQ